MEVIGLNVPHSRQGKFGPDRARSVIIASEVKGHVDAVWIKFIFCKWFRHLKANR